MIQSNTTHCAKLGLMGVQKSLHYIPRLRTLFLVLKTLLQLLPPDFVRVIEIKKYQVFRFNGHVPADPCFTHDGASTCRQGASGPT